MSSRSTTQRSATLSTLLAAAAAALLAGACAGTTPRTGIEPQGDLARADVAAQSVSRSRYIGLGEISTMYQVASAEEVIRRLRPELLRPRRAHSGFQTLYQTPVVYLNGVRLGGLEMLATIPATVMQDVRYLSEVEAGLRFMGDHPVGAIVVRTR